MKKGGTRSVVTNPPFDAYIILDFEATCDRNKVISNQEIIEFPLVVVDAYQASVATEFQRYVRPLANPQLSPFCMQLTGIPQEAVNQAKEFTTVMAEALDFIQRCHLGDGPSERSYCFVTCGDWDLQIMLPKQLYLTNNTTLRSSSKALSLPSHWKRWCNIKQFAVSAEAAGAFLTGDAPKSAKGLTDLLKAVGLKQCGRLHSGRDDSLNIAAVVCEFIRRGFPPLPTSNKSNSYAEMNSRTLSAVPHIPDNRMMDLGWCPPDLDPWTTRVEQKHAAHSQRNAGEVPTEDHKQGKQKTKNRVLGLTNGGVHKDPQEKRAHCFDDLSSPAAPERCFVSVRTDANLVNAALEPFLCNLQSSGGTVNEVALSKALSRILRHSADLHHIPISVNGFVKILDLLGNRAFPFRNKPQDQVVAQIYQAVCNSDKQRFTLGVSALDSTTLYIRANQGHSLQGIEVEMKRIVSPEEAPVAIHGTNFAAWKKIQECGYLSTMNRLHIHFAKGLPKEAGVISGMRRSACVHLYLDVAKVLKDEVLLFKSSNDVILTPGVGNSRQLPLDYIKEVKIINKPYQ